MLSWLLASWALLWSSVSVAQNIENVRVWPSAEKTRVVFDLSAEPTYTYFTLFDNQPYRIVIDFQNTANQVDLSAIEIASDVVTVIRTSGSPRAGTSRIVLEINSATAPEIFPLGPSGNSGHRLVVDIAGATDLSQVVAESQSSTPATSAPRVPRTLDAIPIRPLVVAIDAGHGGRDPGSIGPAGNFEKVITLAVARKLAARVNADPGMRAVLTRTGDQSLSLAQRTSVVRRERADFFVSIHADAFTTPQPRGASVWILSKRRSDTELGRALENKERLSEELIDVVPSLENSEDDPYLNRTFLDMLRDNSMADGHEAATIILDQLGRVTNLHRDKPEGASFGVLSALRTPSVLVELGFISNPQKERLLINNSHQDRLANALYLGIREFFLRNPVAGTSLAELEIQTHVVARGESLSVIAARYGVRVADIKAQNNLRSNTIRVGQQLEIPLGR
ncbi:N-acetylmuramoyl-L-alanine amidase [Aliidiomarina iranensis]|uniref:N-acetylmuramoyl-L-alanine amidase n=1 Tax=Aliidiomarina iranensis TaxID=1434071 RepID=A0A432W2I5_9GAMM|nr:N-acetylmuramoyl-L-alanine amidase [Aliidiomarina iranensis]RUO23418.1 N-acetylmuramoyl-L-alanine amidase [Aliidiomarina iranensis]